MRAMPMLVAFLVLRAVGCTSVKSTLINRTENDVFIGNSNGKPKKTCAARPFNGIPITMRVPTHVDVVVKEKILMKSDGAHKLVRVTMQKRHLFVETAIIETEKVFTVDIKRPAAGTLDYDMKFGDNENSQYFTNIDSKIVDKTIQDITEAIGTVTKAIKTSAGEPQVEGRDLDVKLIPEVRTVAWRRFDLDAFDLEPQIAEFINQHMNGCNTCQALDALAVPPATTYHEMPTPILRDEPVPSEETPAPHARQ